MSAPVLGFNVRVAAAASRETRMPVWTLAGWEADFLVWATAGRLRLTITRRAGRTNNRACMAIFSSVKGVERVIWTDFNAKMCCSCMKKRFFARPLSLRYGRIGLVRQMD